MRNGSTYRTYVVDLGLPCCASSLCSAALQNFERMQHHNEASKRVKLEGAKRRDQPKIVHNFDALWMTYLNLWWVRPDVADHRCLFIDCDNYSLSRNLSESFIDSEFLTFFGLSSLEVPR